MADDTITFTGKADQLIAMYQQIRNEAMKNEKQLKEQRELSKQAAREERERIRAAKQSYEQTRTPMEHYTNAKKKENDLLKRGLIDQDTYNRRMRQHRDTLRGVTGEQIKFGEALSATMAGALTVGVGVVGMMKQIFEMQKKIQRGAKEEKIKVEGAFRNVRQNFAGDDTISEAQFDSEVMALAKRQKISVDVAAAVLDPALSSKGSKKNRDAFNAAETALSFTKDATKAAGLAGAIGDYSKFNESQDASAILGFLVQAQSQARLTDVAQMGKTSAPAVAAVIEKGGSAETGMELFAALTQLNSDPTGESTSTALINLVTKLDKFVSTQGMAPTQAVQFLQRNEEARTEFLKANTFEAKAAPGIRSLLSGDARGLEALQQAQSGIGTLNAIADDRNRKAFEKRRDFVQGKDTYGGVISTALGESKTSLGIANYNDNDGAETDAVRDILYNTLDDTRNIKSFIPDSIIKGHIKSNFEAFTESQNSLSGEEQGRNAVQSAQTILSGLLDKTSGSDRSRIQEQLNILGKMHSEMLRVRQVLESQPATAVSPLQMNSRDMRGAR